MAEPNARTADTISARTDPSNDGATDQGTRVSSDPPLKQAPVRLGLVSKTAAARLAEEPHASDDAGGHAMSVEPNKVAPSVRHLGPSRPRPDEFSPPQLKGEVRLLLADFDQIQPVGPRRSRKAPVVILVILLSAAVVSFIGMEELPYLNSWDRQAIDRSSPSQKVKNVPAQQSESPIPRMLVRGDRGMTGEPLPLGVSLYGEAAGAFVVIAGLIPGMTLSTGTAVGADAWQVRATDVADTWIGPPTQFIGMVDLVVELHLPDQRIIDRQSIHLEWAAPPSVLSTAGPPGAVQPPARLSGRPEQEEDRTVPSPDEAVHVQPSRASQQSPQAVPDPVKTPDNPAAMAQGTVAPAPPHSAPAPVVASANPTTAGSRQSVSPATAGPTPPKLSQEEIAILVQRGKDLIASGDFSAARVVLHRAAESKDAAAALMLGATYDPVVLRGLNVYGLTADVAMARTWYQKAKEFGSPEASGRLEILAREAR